MKTICILLLGCLVAFGQAFTMQDTAFLGNSIQKATTTTGFTPLTEPTGSGANIQTWWRGDSYVTNGSTFQITDLAGINNWHLTNMAATSLWPRRTSSNTWTFTGNVAFGQYVQSIPFTNSGIREVWFVTKLNNAGGANANAYVFDSRNTSFRASRFNEVTSTGQAELCFGANTLFEANADAKWTNHWIAYFFDSDKAAQGFWGTNGVVLVSPANFGSGTVSGFAINGRANDLAFGWGQEWAEAIYYSATNSLAARSNIYYYLKTYSSVCTNLGLP